MGISSVLAKLYTKWFGRGSPDLFSPVLCLGKLEQIRLSKNSCMDRGGVASSWGWGFYFEAAEEGGGRDSSRNTRTHRSVHVNVAPTLWRPAFFKAPAIERLNALNLKGGYQRSLLNQQFAHGVVGEGGFCGKFAENLQKFAEICEMAQKM